MTADIEETYTRYRDSIPSMVASELARRYPLPHRELEEEARSMMGVAILVKWDSISGGRASIHTCLHHRVRWDLLSELQKRRDPLAAPHRDVLVQRHRHRSTSWIERLLEDLSREARMLLEAILSAPEEVTRLCWSGKGKKRLRRYLRKELGWSMTSFLEAWQEIKDRLE